MSELHKQYAFVDEPREKIKIPRVNNEGGFSATVLSVSLSLAICCHVIGEEINDNNVTL